MDTHAVQLDYKVILDMIPENSTVLDLGCGNGELLDLLVQKRKVKGHGIEINEKAIYECVARGLSVFHGDLDTGLKDYVDKSFDYVILNETMQQLRQPDIVISDALRVGRHVIVGFPNFAHLTARIQMFFEGKTPITKSLPYEWHDTPNLHFLTILDFEEYCRKRNITVEKKVFIKQNQPVLFLPNLIALIAIFLISK